MKTFHVHLNQVTEQQYLSLVEIVLQCADTSIIRYNSIQRQKLVN